MKRNQYVTSSIWLLTLTFVVMACVRPQAESTKEQLPAVHAVSDLSHQFTFYADGRFYTQYLQSQKGKNKGVMNWCTLSNFDFSNANLLILLGADDRLAYTKPDVETINSFLESGGGVIIFGSEKTETHNALLTNYGAEFTAAATYPLSAHKEINQKEIKGKNGSVLSLDNEDNWNTLIHDANQRPVLARRDVGKGQLVASSRSLAGSHPSAKDSINQKMWQALLPKVASGKNVDANSVLNACGMQDLANNEDHGTFKLSYTDYLEPYAEAMVEVYQQSLPNMKNRMGVPLSPGMAKKIILLPTGGGGFSTGNLLGLAVWWGGFPEREDSMIEFVTHESIHSWVLPFPEVWNEPIATYVGNLVMMDMGYEQEAKSRIQNQIKRALKHDPEMDTYGIRGVLSGTGTELTDNQKNDIHWGKSFWIFEQLRKENPDVVADYFKMKREHATEEKITDYGINNTVAVLSLAMDRDLFDWFNEHGIVVEKAKAEIEI